MQYALRTTQLKYLSLCIYILMYLLEIKPCGLGSRIREAEWRLKVIIDIIPWIYGKQNWRCGMNQTLSAKMKTDSEK